MATYKEIQKKYKEKFNRTCKTCWIADVKERCGLSIKPTHKNERVVPCPEDKVEKVKEIFKEFGMLE